MYKVVVCTVAAVVVAAGCAEDGSANSALPPAASHPSRDSSTSPATVDGSTTSDGLVSPEEAARASELIRSSEIVADLLDRYGGQLTPWEPAELEGEPRGAFATIEFPEPISMSPTVIRPEADPPPTRVQDYVLESVQLGLETVERYGVTVDLKTMAIVHLTPMPAPPTTVAAPPD